MPPQGTRPTSDRVREALFNALHARVDLAGAYVLDLYAGSGALGLEALSRGAAQVVLVESDARAAAILESNVAAVGLPGARVRVASVAATIGGAADRAYDVVIADPPYAVDGREVEAMLTALLTGGWVQADSVVAVERSSRSEPTNWPQVGGLGFEPLRVRTYGETRIEMATCYGSTP